MKCSDQRLIFNLLTPESVRDRCNEIFKIAKNDDLEHFQYHPKNFRFALEYVLEEFETRYPDGNIPLHSRWRHFEFGEQNLWQELFDHQSGLSSAERARRRIDLVVISVLLDAGVGPEWQYKDTETGLVFGRSEGLALASLRLVQSGVLSRYGSADPIRVDASRLTAITPADVAKVFQVSNTNRLSGLEERTQVLVALGDRLLMALDVFGFGEDVRPGHLFDYLVKRVDGGTVKAREILIALLVQLRSIWPEGESIKDISVGDVGFHQRIIRNDITNGILPFHKLSQWMTYSLVEPLEESQIKVVELDSLTGLAEYRNGGLFIDTKILSLKNAEDARKAHHPKSELVVEWRALTVALLDDLANLLRKHMGKNCISLPLASILQGGTWFAGRRIAKKLRLDGRSPLRIKNTGTIF